MSNKNKPVKSTIVDDEDEEATTRKHLREFTKSLFDRKPLHKMPYVADTSGVRKSATPRIRKKAMKLLNESGDSLRGKMPTRRLTEKFFDDSTTENEGGGSGIQTGNDSEVENINNRLLSGKYVDKDDSMLDVESLGKQTPFLNEQKSFIDTIKAGREALLKMSGPSNNSKKAITTPKKKNEEQFKFFNHNESLITSGHEVSGQSGQGNRYSFIEYEYLEESSNFKNFGQNVPLPPPSIPLEHQNKKDQTLDMSRRKDESIDITSFNETDTIDEILLIADDGKVENLEEEYKRIKEEEKQMKRRLKYEQRQAGITNTAAKKTQFYEKLTNLYEQKSKNMETSRIPTPIRNMTKSPAPVKQIPQQQQQQTSSTRIPMPVNKSQKNKKATDTSFSEVDESKQQSTALEDIYFKPDSTASQGLKGEDDEYNRLFLREAFMGIDLNKAQKDDETSNLLDDIIPDSKLIEDSSLIGTASFQAESQLATPSITSTHGGAFKFYQAFADELLADGEDGEEVDDPNMSISYDAVMDQLNIKIKALDENKEDDVIKTTKSPTLQQPPPPPVIKKTPPPPKTPTKLKPKIPTPTKSLNKTNSNGMTSPFVSIENRIITTNTSKKPVSKPQPPQKQRSVTSIPKATSKSQIVQRPASTYDDKYSFDSEDVSIVVDMDLKSKLKEEQKKRKMTDELLDQLQSNYNQLLEKHALAENVIDTLRLGAKLQIQQDTLPNTNIQRGNMIHNVQKGQVGQMVAKGGQLLDTTSHPFTTTATATTTSISVTTTVPSIKDNMINGGNDVNKMRFDDFTDDYLSVFGGSTVAASNHQGQIDNDQINMASQQTKLGILFQTRQLEEKMQSFITLMDEKQLTLTEQRQVYDSIKKDYENLISNYQEAKNIDPTGALPNEIDLDIDLNKELEKMKDLLKDIVRKLTNNLVLQSPSGSVSAPERKSSIPTSSISSFGNHDEIMDQYNRLLEIFNTDVAAGGTKQLIGNNSENAVHEITNGKKGYDKESGNNGRREIHKSELNLELNVSEGESTNSFVSTMLNSSVNQHTTTTSGAEGGIGGGGSSNDFLEDDDHHPQHTTTTTTTRSDDDEEHRRRHSVSSNNYKIYTRKVESDENDVTPEENRPHHVNHNQIQLTTTTSRGQSKPQTKINASSNNHRKSSSDSYNKNQDSVTNSRGSSMSVGGTNLIVNSHQSNHNNNKKSSSNHDGNHQQMSHKASNGSIGNNGGRAVVVKGKQNGSKQSIVSMTMVPTSTTSSNENIDNGYYTMTHNTPHHHLAGEDGGNGVVVMTNAKARVYSNEVHHKSSGSQPKIVVVDKSSTSTSDVSTNEEENEYTAEGNANSQIYKATAQLGKVIASMAVEKARKQIMETTSKEGVLHKRGAPLNEQQYNLSSSTKGSARQLPVAKAYEGSDSGEDIEDYLTERRNEENLVVETHAGNIRLQQTSNQRPSQHIHIRPSSLLRTEEQSANESTSSTTNSNTTTSTNSTNSATDVKFRNNFNKLLQKLEDGPSRGYENIKSEDEYSSKSEHSNTSSDASSIIYRPQKNTKSEIMQQLADEVEELKQKILERKSIKNGVRSSHSGSNSKKRVQEGMFSSKKHFDIVSKGGNNKSGKVNLSKTSKSQHDLQTMEKCYVYDGKDKDDESFEYSIYETPDGRLVKLVKDEILERSKKKKKRSTLTHVSNPSIYNTSQEELNARRNDGVKKLIKKPIVVNVDVEDEDEANDWSDFLLNDLKNERIPYGAVSVARRSDNGRAVYYDKKGRPLYLPIKKSKFDSGYLTNSSPVNGFFSSPKPIYSKRLIQLQQSQLQTQPQPQIMTMRRSVNNFSIQQQQQQIRMTSKSNGHLNYHYLATCPICDHDCIYKNNPNHNNNHMTNHYQVMLQPQVQLHHQQQPRKNRKVRYYVREYGDASSDNEVVYQ